jgi:hypothetical protein
MLNALRADLVTILRIRNALLTFYLVPVRYSMTRYKVAP